MSGYQLSLFDPQIQFDLPQIDRGLLARHEDAQAQKLTEFIDRVLTYIGRSSTLRTPEVHYQAITLAFWIVASRILRDAGVESFAGIDYSNPDDVLGRVRAHYGAALPIFARHAEWKPGLAEACEFARTFWGLSAAAIGPEVLGRVNETVRISDAQRIALGAHSTPTFLVDYIVSGLADHIAKIPPERRLVAEPACGHAGFLVAALRLLSAEVPAGFRRHDYLRSMVRGQDLDAVSSEVARLSLTLADIPNPDGWSISGGEDVFINGGVERLVGDAMVILANPPFEEFSDDEIRSLACHDVYPEIGSRGVELFRRCMEAAQPGALLGFVLPPSFADAPRRASIALRHRLLERADLLEVTELPDKVFRKAGTPSIVILARVRLPGESPATNWQFRSVDASDLPSFRVSGRPTREVVVRRQDVLADPVHGLRVPLHSDTWSLRSWQTLGSVIIDCGQGGILNAAPRKTRSRDGTVKPINPKLLTDAGETVRHLTLGVQAKGTSITKVPPIVETYQQAHTRPLPKTGRPTGRSRVVLNRARRSRRDWWMQAFIDPEGHQVAGDGFVVEPGAPPWDSHIIWAVLNSAFANVFMSTHLTENSISPATFRLLPIPHLSAKAEVVLRTAVDACFAADSESLPDQMLRLDAVMHALYGLRAVDEWAIISRLEGTFRPGVGEYRMPPDVDRRVPLYLQLGLLVPLPSEPQIPDGLDERALFAPQEALYAEVAALDDIWPRPENAVAARRHWLVEWRRALQEREAAMVPSAVSLSPSLLTDIERLRRIFEDSGS